MKILIIFFASAFFATCSFGQTSFKRNDIYFEAGGNGLFSSINYERQLTSQPGLGFRVGLGFYSENAFYLTIPTGVNYLFKLKNENSFIDAGLGATWTRNNGELFSDSSPSNGEHFVSFVPSIGYPEAHCEQFNVANQRHPCGQQVRTSSLAWIFVGKTILRKRSLI